MKRILVPIAFSHVSQAIINYAVSLAEPLGAELHIANVINQRDLEAVEKISSFGYQVDGEHYVDTIKKERAAILKEYLENCSLAEDQITFSFHIGDPSTELLKLVVDEDIDLVVMGVKAKDIRHIFTGSVAERMFRRCPCPIVSFRDKETSSRLKKRIEKMRD